MNIPRTKIVILVLLSAFWTLAGTSCNTYRGFGEDMENAGRGIQKSSN